MQEFCRVYYEIVVVRNKNPYTFVKWAKDVGINTTQWLTPDSIDAFESEYPRLSDPIIHTTESIEAMLVTCESNGIELQDFFGNTEVPEIMLLIEHGYLSPWVFLISNNAINNFLSRLDKAAWKHLDYIIDLDYWDKRIEECPDDVKSIKDILIEFGIN